MADNENPNTDHLEMKASKRKASTRSWFQKLKSFCSPAPGNKVPECETLEKSDENKALEEELAEVCERGDPESSEEQCLALEEDAAIVALKRCKVDLLIETESAKSTQGRQKAVKVCCAQFEAEKHVICCQNEALQDELDEINKNVEPQWSVEYAAELQLEITGLKKQTAALQEELKQAKSKLEQQPDMKQQCLELENERNGVREEKEAVQDELTQLWDKLERETCSKTCLEKEIEALMSHTDVLRVELEHANGKLQEPVSFKEQYLELQAKKQRAEDENKSIWRRISQANEKFFQEKSWRHKVEATHVWLRAMESENEQLLKHVKKLEKEVSIQATAASGHKLLLRKVDNMNEDNVRLQKYVVQLVTKIRNYKSVQEDSKNTAKKDAQVKAENKQLRKTVGRLREELEKLRRVEVEQENVTHDLDELQEENRSLHDQIRALNAEITSKKFLQLHLNSLKAEKKWMVQRWSGLNQELSWLRGHLWEQQPLCEEIRKLKEGNECSHEKNQQLRRRMEEMFAEVARAEVHQVLTGVAQTQRDEMDRLNQELMEENEWFRTTL